MPLSFAKSVHHAYKRHWCITGNSSEHASPEIPGSKQEVKQGDAGVGGKGKWDARKKRHGVVRRMCEEGGEKRQLDMGEYELVRYGAPGRSLKLRHANRSCLKSFLTKNKRQVFVRASEQSQKLLYEDYKTSYRNPLLY